VINSGQDIEGAFTPDGFSRMLDAIAHHVDPQFRLENSAQSLLKQPAVNVEALLKIPPGEEANRLTRGFSREFSEISGKFPFNPSSSQDAPIEAMNAIFAPNTGKLWQLYSTALSQFLIRQRSQFVANTQSNANPSPAFITFFNRATALSDALYAGSPTPRVTFNLRQASTSMDSLAITIGGETLAGTGQLRTFTWTGASLEVVVTTKDVPINNYVAGPWSVFRFFNDGRPQAKIATISEITYTYRGANGHEVLNKDGQKQFYTYDLQIGGTTPLHFSDFAGLNCVPLLAH